MMLMFSFGLFLLTIEAAFGCSPASRQQFIQQARSPCASGVLLSIKYISRIECGTLQHTSATIFPPSVNYSNADPSRTYTLLMVTADNPGSNLDTLVVFLHWAITGVQGCEILSGRHPWGAVGYIPPFPGNPPQFDYKFILLQEPRGQSVSIYPGIDRFGFDLGAFMTANNMCSAVAMSQISVKA